MPCPSPLSLILKPLLGYSIFKIFFYKKKIGHFVKHLFITICDFPIIEHVFSVSIIPQRIQNRPGVKKKFYYFLCFFFFESKEETCHTFLTLFLIQRKGHPPPTITPSFSFPSFTSSSLEEKKQTHPPQITTL